jgi:hypothetical protein
LLLYAPIRESGNESDEKPGGRTNYNSHSIWSTGRQDLFKRKFPLLGLASRVNGSFNSQFSNTRRHNVRN